MPDPTTPNLLLAIPAHLSDPGAWDTPLNNNFTLLDSIWGAVVTVGLTNVNVTLPSNQWQVGTIIFTGALSGNVSVFLPAAGSRHTVANKCTGNFVVRLASLGGGRVIGLPPGEYIDVVCDGTNMDYRSLRHHVGGYWDHGGTAVPSWVSACTVPPYLLCDGSGFSGVTYPALAAYLGGTTLPDGRGRARFFMNGGTGRVTGGGSGVDGNTLLASGGNELMQQHQHDAFIGDDGHSHPNLGGTTTTPGGASAFTLPGSSSGATGSATTGVKVRSTAGSAASADNRTANQGSGGSQNMPPAYIGGITMIRAG